MDLNKAMLIGRLTRDPEMRSTPQGTNVCSFSVATNFVYTDASGSKQERAEYHNIVAWRKLGEIAHQYLKRGSKVFVEGRLQTRTWEGQDGKKNYKTEIIMDNMIMLDAKGAKNDAQGKDQFAQADEIPTINQDQPSDEEITVEDIPF